ncbi:MAG: MBL fold metallo-hydrolase [Campylobacter sp.]|nr:MBL fold metallo-hydrolase [Campylobacter sp.]
MEILRKHFGRAVTNCYVVVGKSGENGTQSIIIDPGEGAYKWAVENAVNLQGVFLTHGHYDHVYDAKFFAQKSEIYIHEDDEFMLISDPFGIMPNTFNSSKLAKDGDEFKVGGFSVKFHHFPGHTPGCCMLEVNFQGSKSVIFSGDFLFEGSIGRYDFPFSDAGDMKESLEKALKIKNEYEIYPGHGRSSTLQSEKDTIEYFLGIL